MNKKEKKKLIAKSLLTSMVLCNSMTAWAADTWDGSTYTQGGGDDSSTRVVNNGGQKDVTAEFNLGDQGESYSVDISWGSMEFTPTPTTGGGLQVTWDDEAGEYKIDNYTGWTCDEGANKIKVTNKSNVDITATFNTTINTEGFLNKYVADGDKGSSELNVEDTELDIDCPLTSTSNEQTNTVSVNANITRAPHANINDVTLGTVTVTIAKKE